MVTITSIFGHLCWSSGEMCCRQQRPTEWKPRTFQAQFFVIPYCVKSSRSLRPLAMPACRARLKLQLTKYSSLFHATVQSNQQLLSIPKIKMEESVKCKNSKTTICKIKILVSCLRSTVALTALRELQKQRCAFGTKREKMTDCRIKMLSCSHNNSTWWVYWPKMYLRYWVYKLWSGARNISGLIICLERIRLTGRQNIPAVSLVLLKTNQS